MPATPRQYSLADRLLLRLGETLRASTPLSTSDSDVQPHPVPATEGGVLSGVEARQAARLMRINHAGEVAAQGLYQGQAMVARSPAVRRQLLDAAAEEREHLAWCESRLGELGDGPSKLTPLWYAGSRAIGVLAGLAGDGKSLGFVAETERQVSAHLDEHLHQLPAADSRSRAVLKAMKADEERHGAQALAAGGALPPAPVRGLMRLVAGVMKFGAARI